MHTLKLVQIGNSVGEQGLCQGKRRRRGRGGLPGAPALPPGSKNYMTVRGHAAMRAEFEHLVKVERPNLVQVVSWAAGNGDRSENGD